MSIDFSKEFGPGVTTEGVFLDNQGDNHEVRVVSASGVVHHAVFKGAVGADVMAWSFAAYADDLIAAPAGIVSLTGGVALV